MTTPIGRFFEKRSISKHIVARKTGISDNRMTELTESDPRYPYAHEVHLIALAINMPPADLFDYLCKDVKLQVTEPQSGL